MRDLRQNVPDLANVALFPVATNALNSSLLDYEESLVERFYKFGVLLCRPGQTTEQEWYQNTDMPPSLEAFMSLMGERVALKGWKDYAGGLDCKDGRTGTHMYYTRCVFVYVHFRAR